MEGRLGRNRKVAFALAGTAMLALFVLAALAANAIRLGGAITREVERAELDYIRGTGSGELVETNALLLGHCLREEMLKSARPGIVHPDAWAVHARIKALPACAPRLREVPPTAPSLITAPRARPIVTGFTRPGSTIDPTGDKPAETTKGHGTAAPGPSGSSDRASDLQGPGLAKDVGVLFARA